MTQYEAVIGLEVHAQLLTRTKIFCGCPTTFGAAPNQQICPVCTGQPGVLPVLNRRAAECTIRAGLATHCRIAPRSVFARKNYFYPDLPKGYQISQYDQPLCAEGYVDITFDGTAKRITIIRIHLEEDAGKLLHDFGHPEMSHADLNRAGVPLMEIVSGPDMRSPKEAIAYLKTLRAIVMYLDVCDGNMQEGSFRCDANVSVRPVGSTTFGTRAELKNLNSFRFLERALDFEIDRQVALMESGGTVVQETRLWNEARSVTESMRSKEEAHDYRYFPDPDLLPLVVHSPDIEMIRAHLPELAEQKVTRFTTEYGLTEYDARLLTSEKALATYFETACESYLASDRRHTAGGEGRPAPDDRSYAKRISNWILTELMAKLNSEGHDITESRIAPAALAALVGLIDAGTISGKMAKAIFEEMYATGRDPDTIVRAKGLVQVSDTSVLDAAIDTVIAAQPGNVAEYRRGKTQLFGFFVGEVMKQTKGQANPRLVNELLRKKLH